MLTHEEVKGRDGVVTDATLVSCFVSTYLHKNKRAIHQQLAATCDCGHPRDLDSHAHAFTIAISRLAEHIFGTHSDLSSTAIVVRMYMLSLNSEMPI